MGRNHNQDEIPRFILIFSSTLPTIVGQFPIFTLPPKLSLVTFTINIQQVLSVSEPQAFWGVLSSSISHHDFFQPALNLRSPDASCYPESMIHDFPTNISMEVEFLG